EEQEVSNRAVKSTAHHSFRHVVATAHDPGFHSGQREFDGWNPQEEKVDFISQLLEAANHAQVAPARKSRLKAEALAVFYRELNLFEHQPPGGKAAASGLNGDTPCAIKSALMKFLQSA